MDGSRMQYIYALITEKFESKQDYFDASPTTEYFYVGRTKDIAKRKGNYASKARTGSEYPYHQKIRDYGENWEIEELEKAPDDEVGDHEEFYMIKLIAEGHPLQNIKRGDSIKRQAQAIFGELKKSNVSTSKDYSKLKNLSRELKVVARERRQIEKSLIHIGLDESGENRLWRLGEKEIVADRYVSRKEIVQMSLPSENKKLSELFAKVSFYVNSNVTA